MTTNGTSPQARRLTKVLVISDFDQLAVDLNANLRQGGYASVLLTTKFLAGDHSAVNVSRFKRRRVQWFVDAVRSFLYRNVILRITGYSFYQDISEDGNYFGIERIKARIRDTPDVIIILFDYRIVTTRTIADLWLWSKARILWMMVDMKPMTGGCSYAGDCKGYQADCRDCPAIGRPWFKGFAGGTLGKKIANLRGVDCRLLAGSTFQATQARQSTLFREKRVDAVFFPSDGRVFRYRDKQEARRILGLPTAQRIVMWGAARIDQPRKGFPHLLKALRLLKESSRVDDPLLLIVGGGDLPELRELPYRAVHLGMVGYERLALAYQAADVFVCPTLEDSGPIMVNQSIMCGTPVVAFKMGVCLDLIADGRTGYLAELGDAIGLCHGLERLLGLSEPERERISGECLRVAEALGFDSFFATLDAMIQGR